MGFWQFIWYFLGQAFFIPWNITANIAGILAIISGIAVWKRPNWETTVKHLLWIVPLAIFIILAPIGWITASYNIYGEQQTQISNLQDNLQQTQQQYRPILIISRATEIKTSLDETKQRADFDITFHVENVGNGAAYQLFSRICFAPQTQPQNIYSNPDSTTVNPIQPHEEILKPTGISQHFERSNNTMLVEGETWFIYYFLKYSDALTGGNWYSDEYWFALSLNLQIVRDLGLKEKQAFQPFVTAYYEKQ